MSSGSGIRVSLVWLKRYDVMIHSSSWVYHVWYVS